MQTTFPLRSAFMASAVPPRFPHPHRGPVRVMRPAQGDTFHRPTWQGRVPFRGACGRVHQSRIVPRGRLWHRCRHSCACEHNRGLRGGDAQPVAATGLRFVSRSFCCAPAFRGGLRKSRPIRSRRLPQRSATGNARKLSTWSTAPSQPIHRTPDSTLCGAVSMGAQEIRGGRSRISAK